MHAKPNSVHQTLARARKTKVIAHARAELGSEPRPRFEKGVGICGADLLTADMAGLDSSSAALQHSVCHKRIGPRSMSMAGQLGSEHDGELMSAAPPAVVCSESATLEPVPGPRRSTSRLLSAEPSSCSIWSRP